MSELSNHYQQIMKDLQNNIKNKEDKEFVLCKFQELSMMFMDVIDRLTNITDLRIKEIEAKHKEIDKKMSKIQKAVDEIEGDIYEDGDSYEFEIVCPYCNHEFVTDINADASTEVECPECHNMIELDWNGDEDDECGENCSCCSHQCVAEEDEEYDDFEDLEELDDDDDKAQKKATKSHKKMQKKDGKSKEQDDDDM